MSLRIPSKAARSVWGLALGISSLIAALIPQLGFVLAIMGLALCAEVLRRRQRAGIATVAGVICSLSIALNSVLFIQVQRSRDRFAQLKDVGGERVDSTVKKAVLGLQKSELPLSAATVYGYWLEEDVFDDDSQVWSGSAGAYSEKDGKLYLVTNAHILGLDDLFDADGGGVPEIKEYGLSIKFPSGVTLPVLQFGIQRDGIDIAFLVVDASKVRRGTDYVFLPFDENNSVEQGDEVVAVGSPEGLAGTQTFGRVSALRDDLLGNRSYRVIQTDAALNHGNSGGPLFARRDERYICVGINTFGFDGAQNLGFAIDASAILKSDSFYWSDASTGALQKWVDQP